MFSCRPCDYDECDACFSSRAVEGEERGKEEEGKEEEEEEVAGAVVEPDSTTLPPIPPEQGLLAAAAALAPDLTSAAVCVPRLSGGQLQSLCPSAGAASSAVCDA
jgi:hypothetical protein